MSNTKQVSIFDVIGPIMVGPSSSHTAGAVRLGIMARAILGHVPVKAGIELHGSFAQTGKGHGTDRAIIAGLLNLPPDDPGIRYSFELAKEAGLSYTFEETDFEGDEEVHPNTARITLSDADEHTIQMTGSSIGGGSVEVTNVQGYDVRFGGECHTLLIIADDQPGTVSAITGWLFKRNINIAFMRVERQRRGGQAIMILETDDDIPPELVEAVENFNWVRWVRQVDKIGE